MFISFRRGMACGMACVRLVGWLLFDINREWRREGPLKWTSQSAEVESNQPMGKWRSKGRVIGTISRIIFCKWQLLWWYERMMMVPQ